MFVTKSIIARDLPEAFFLCCRSLLEGLDTIHKDNGIYVYTIDKGSFQGRQRLEFDFVTIHIENPSNRPLVPDVPVGVPTPASLDQIEDYMAYLITEDIKPDEQYTYGQCLTQQYTYVIERYKAHGPNCNQLTMRIGDKNSILLDDPQCLCLVDTRIRYGKLHFVIYFRSWDLWAGFPVNLGGLQLLKEYMAKEIGVEDGSMVCLSKGLHLYDHCWEIARQAYGR